MTLSPHFKGTFIFAYLIRSISDCAFHTSGNVHKSCQERICGIQLFMRNNDALLQERLKTTCEKSFSRSYQKGWLLV